MGMPLYWAMALDRPNVASSLETLVDEVLGEPSGLRGRLRRPVLHRPVRKNADKYCRVCGKNFTFDETDRRFYWSCTCDPTLE
jgi:hypothetical protein